MGRTGLLEAPDFLGLRDDLQKGLLYVTREGRVRRAMDEVKNEENASQDNPSPVEEKVAFIKPTRFA